MVIVRTLKQCLLWRRQQFSQISVQWMDHKRLGRPTAPFYASPLSVKHSCSAFMREKLVSQRVNGSCQKHEIGNINFLWCIIHCCCHMSVTLTNLQMNYFGDRVNGETSLLGHFTLRHSHMPKQKALYCRRCNGEAQWVQVLHPLDHGWEVMVFAVFFLKRDKFKPLHTWMCNRIAFFCYFGTTLEAPQAVILHRMMDVLMEI